MIAARRDSVLADDSMRASLESLEQRLARELAGIDTRLGLLQHKVMH
jgi:hypothetical protein